MIVGKAMEEEDRTFDTKDKDSTLPRRDLSLSMATISPVRC